MGGFCPGGGVTRSAAQGATSTARDPAVRRTGSNTGTQTRGSSPRPPARPPTQVERTVYNVTGNIARDLTMGFSTFGQSKEKQAETLRSKGYSDDVIKDYQERTAASQARLREQMARSNDNDNDSRPAPAPKPTPAPAPVAAAPTPTPPPAPTAPTPISATPGTGVGTAASGEAEAAAIEATAKGPAEKETAKTARKGRRSTIQTGAQGLLTRAKTRRRRSLLGGDQDGGLLS